MELVQLVGVYRLHDPDDVLHRCVWLDARLHGEDGHRRVRRSKRRRGRRRVLCDARQPYRNARLDARGHRDWLSRVQPRSAEGRRAHHEDHDDLPVVRDGGARVSLGYAARGRGRPRILSLPDFEKMFGGGIGHFGEVVYAAMGQAFFTLSLGIGAMEVFGSRIGNDRALTGEALRICGLDTFVAIVAGLIIFPACFAFAVAPDQGPALVFVTLPNVFEQMPFGQVWGTLFFVFMSFAALSTIIAVFECLITFTMERWNVSRSQAIARTALLVTVLSIPCALGFNVWSGVGIPGIGDIQSIEDFIVSNNLLPLGSLLYVIFCVTRSGWGWDNFLKAADVGEGIKFPRWSRYWLTFGVPILIGIIFVMGYAPKFALWFGLG